MHSESPRYEMEGGGTTTDISWRGYKYFRRLKVSLAPLWGKVSAIADGKGLNTRDNGEE